MHKWLRQSPSWIGAVLCLAPVGFAFAEERGRAAVSATLPQLCAPTQVFESKKLKAYAVSPVRKVFAKDAPDAWGNVTVQDKIRLSLARNEMESFFLVLRPETELKDVKISFAWKSRGNANDRLTARPTGSYRRVAEVPVPGFSRWYGMLGAELGAIPDPLLADKPFTAPAGLNRVLLVEVGAGLEVPPGRATGAIRVHVEGTTVASIPLELEIWDIALPTRPVLQTLSHNLEVRSRASWTFLRNAGVTALKYGPTAPAVRLREDGKLEIDFTEYKKGLDVVFNQLGYDYVLVPPSLLGSISSLSKSYLGLGIQVGSKRFWPVFDQYMKRMGDFYRTHGWEKKVIFYMFDEINEEHHPLVIRLAERARLHYPEVKVMITTHVMSDKLAAALDAWCVPWHFFATNPEHIPNWRKWQRDGLELWAYMNSLYTLNSRSTLAANRFYPAVLAKYGYKGNFWWGIAYNGNKNPWTEFHRHGNAKQGMYGNGLLFYPPRAKKTVPFEPWHSSLRWESYRQGLDEFALLENLAKLHEQVRRSLGKSAVKAAFSSQRMRLEWGALLAEKFRRQTYRRDAEYLHRFRQLLAQEIQTIGRQPLGLIEVANVSGPTTADATALIRGVCPAGVRVTVAGKPIPIPKGKQASPQDAERSAAADAFVFETKVRLQPGRNLIPVRLADGNGNAKTFYREVDYRASP